MIKDNKIENKIENLRRQQLKKQSTIQKAQFLELQLESKRANTPYRFTFCSSKPSKHSIFEFIQTESPMISNGYIQFGKSQKDDHVDYLKERFTEHLISPGTVFC